MFAKRTKKTFPEGTFIPTPARVVSIIQLCLAFVIILWNLSEPFTGELFSVRSKLILYDDVMGTAPRQGLSSERQEQLDRNAEYFAAVPQPQKDIILKGLQRTTKELHRPFLKKMERSLSILAFNIPSFEQAWLLFSIIISIMLLKKVEGARLAVWLLPVLAVCYAIDNRSHGLKPHLPADAQLFPSEEVIVEDYYRKPLSESIFEQQGQLKEAWNIYLLREWSLGLDNKDEEVDQNEALSNASFRFNLARLNLIATDTRGIPYRQKESLPLLGLYIFWNLLLACIVSKYK